jgi:hypothetical protein
MNAQMKELHFMYHNALLGNATPLMLRNHEMCLQMFGFAALQNVTFHYILDAFIWQYFIYNVAFLRTNMTLMRGALIYMAAR